MSTFKNDLIELDFIDSRTNKALGTVSSLYVSDLYNVPSNNLTSLNFEKDYFIPANRMAFTIGSSHPDTLTPLMQRGNKVVLKINNKPNMIGYIFDYTLSYSRDGGSVITIECKDILGYLEQGTVFPNLGTGAITNVHFPATATLKQAIQGIVQAFFAQTDAKMPEIIIDIDDHGDLTFQSGFDFGLRQTGKTPASRQKSITSALNTITQPNYKASETYLGYITRLIKMAGCNIKVSPTSNPGDNAAIFIVKPPTYDRANVSPFKIIHYTDPKNSSGNNVIEAKYKFSLEKQPSIVVVDTNGGGSTFYQSTTKGFAINEMTGYQLSPDALKSGSTNITDYSGLMLDSVLNAISQLTTAAQGVGYRAAPFNIQLAQVRANMAIDINTEISLPFYMTSNNAHTAEEASYAASLYLAECQDRYVEFTYKVSGWTVPGTDYIWQPDTMVSVVEQMINSNAGSNTNAEFPMWIRKVNYLQDRHNGTTTELTCTLPYTHNFEILP